MEEQVLPTQGEPMPARNSIDVHGNLDDGAIERQEDIEEPIEIVRRDWAFRRFAPLHFSPPDH